MATLLVALQILSGLVSVFLILVKDPKAEGLGAIGSAAHSFKGVKTSADEQLDNITWVAVSLFLLSSLLLGLKVLG